MSLIKQQVYFAIFKVLLYCCLIFVALKWLTGITSVHAVAVDTFYVFLVTFLRSAMIVAVWRIGMKWTSIVSIPIEALAYGGGYIAHTVAMVSFIRYVFNYGFVLYWNPVLTKKDTIANRMVEIVISSVLLGILTPFKLNTIIFQIVLSLHSFWVQTKIVHDVCRSGVLGDTKRVVEEIAAEVNVRKPPIELWIAAYFSAIEKANILPQELVEGYLNPATPWQLRRLIIRGIAKDPTRAQMKSLLTQACINPVGNKKISSTSPVPDRPSLWSSGPLALISTEPNEKVVVNEAIAGLTRLYESLGEKRFLSAFDRSTDGKLAFEIVKNGFK